MQLLPSLLVAGYLYLVFNTPWIASYALYQAGMPASIWWVVGGMGVLVLVLSIIVSPLVLLFDKRG